MEKKIKKRKKKCLTNKNSVNIMQNKNMFDLVFTNHICSLLDYFCDYLN